MISKHCQCNDKDIESSLTFPSYKVLTIETCGALGPGEEENMHSFFITTNNFSSGLQRFTLLSLFVLQHLERLGEELKRAKMVSPLETSCVVKVNIQYI